MKPNRHHRGDAADVCWAAAGAIARLRPRIPRCMVLDSDRIKIDAALAQIQQDLLSAYDESQLRRAALARIVSTMAH